MQRARMRQISLFCLLLYLAAVGHHFVHHHAGEEELKTCAFCALLTGVALAILAPTTLRLLGPYTRCVPMGVLRAAYRPPQRNLSLRGPPLFC